MRQYFNVPILDRTGTQDRFNIVLKWNETYRPNPDTEVLQEALLEQLGLELVPATEPINATWAVFFIPAAILLVWALLDLWLIKDTPEDADFPVFDPHDASSGQMHIELSTMDLLRKVFGSPLMLMIALIGLTSGVMRNGIMTWYFIFAAQVKQTGAEFILKNWGLLLCLPQR